MSKVLIVYIATGDYKTYFDKFKKSLDKFLPKTEKILFLISDDEKFNKKHAIYSRLIEHLPWPIVTLMKFKYINDAIEATKSEEPSHVFYFNANVDFDREVTEKVFLSSRLIAVEHSNLLVHCKNDPSSLRTEMEGISAIDHPYVYVAGGVVGGPIELMKEAATTIFEWTKTELAQNYIPQWHDESYWNKYVDLNQDKVKILPAIYGCPEDDYLMSIYMPSIVYRNSDLTQNQKGK